MTSSNRLSLGSKDVALSIDPDRGADILDITELHTQTQVLFETPWRRRADELNDGLRAPTSTHSVMSWMEHYRGGWQTLFPNAGEPRVIAGAMVGFHGEASISPWTIGAVTTSSARLSTELFSVPVRIDRTVSVEGAIVSISDELTNTSPTTIDADYVSHPAFGGEFLDGACELTTGARQFTVDPSDAGRGAAPGSTHEWPHLATADGGTRDLSVLAPVGEAAAAFGWLSDFESGWAAVTNRDSGVSVRLEWDAGRLPYAWVWQEFTSSASFPWFQRARVIAIEPASTQTSGPQRSSVFHLEPFETTRVEIRMRVDQFTDFPAGHASRLSKGEK